MILLDRFNGHTVAQGDFFLADPEAVPFQRFPRCVCFISRGAENARLFQGTVTGLCALPGKSLRRAGGERGEECVALFIAHAGIEQGAGFQLSAFFIDLQTEHVGFIPFGR